MTSPVLAVDEQLVATTVRLERARVFNDRLVASTFVSPLGIGFVVWLQTIAAGAKSALVWGVLIISVELLINVFGRGFRAAVSNQRPVDFWLHAQLACCGLLGLIWGAAAWFVWSPEYFLFYIATLCAVVGVAFITMVVLAPMRWAGVLFVLGLSIIPIGQLLFISNPIAPQIAIGWLVMNTVQVRYAMELRQELVRQLDSSVRNVILVERLTQVGQELATANAEKDARNAELHAVMEELNQLVTFDQLTGAYSRRSFMEEVDRQVALHARHGSPVSLIMLDLDHFKMINDRHGHSAGDRALRGAALSVQAQLRDGDMLGRIGGEEFLVLLPVTNLESAMSLAERLRVSMSELVMSEGEQAIQISASFGVAELLPDEDTNAWLQRADAALYDAKTLGRNRVVAAKPLRAQP